MIRTTWMLVIGLAAGLAACGEPSEGSSSEEEDGGAGDGDSEGLLAGEDLEGLACDAETCESLGLDCGPVPDGCGEILECGECDEDEACGVADRNVCTTLDDLCMPLPRDRACRGRECGVAGDGCGETFECGGCEEDGEFCGVFEPFRCAIGPEASDDNCVAEIESCAEVGAECGIIGNGCGGTIDCDDETGGCGDAELCGIDEPQVCGSAPECTPLSAEEACDGLCGIVSNGCGTDVDDGLFDCSAAAETDCPSGTVCGGDGVANQCGSGECAPQPEADACSGLQCGVATDGCDGSYECGTCDSGEVCRRGTCEPECQRVSEAEACAGIDCGLVGDGCDGTHDCGGCAAGEQCGVIDAFQCDPIPPSGCVERSDEEACDGKECGIAYDGCGDAVENQVDCSLVNGGCGAGEICGLVEAFQCDAPDALICDATSCSDMGWECGMAVDECGNVYDCSDENLECNSETETCIGGIDAPAVCVNETETTGGTCDVCDAIPDCSAAPQRTVLTGRVVTPGADDADTVNQLGVPNAFVYILRNNDETELPAIEAGIPSVGGQYTTACDRCEDQDLGPVLSSTTTNALGEYQLEGEIPVDQEFVLVVKIGKFRRARRVTLQPTAACSTTVISPLWTRLPRDMNDGLAVNIPRVAVSTGSVDAMECVFYKMGLSATEFAAPGTNGSAPERIHLYIGGGDGGARAAGGSPFSAELYLSQDRLFSYDMAVFDCEGDSFQHNTDDPRMREYVNRGGRLFASHYSYTWIYDNGTTSYADALASGNEFNTGLGPSGVWGSGDADFDTGYVAIGRPRASTGKIQDFADWLVNEGAASPSSDGRLSLSIDEPRDLATSVGAFSEEFVYRSPGDDGQDDICRPCFLIATEDPCAASPSCMWSATTSTCSFTNDCNVKSQAECTADDACSWDGECTFVDDCDSGSVDTDPISCQTRPQCGWDRTSVQQYAFNTPYGAPDDAICGRVAYSGFHVVSDAAGYSNAVFPDHCTGDLGEQEKVLLYMLFDLGACVSTEGLTPPECEPVDDCTGRCGMIPDGCGGTVDCAECPAGQVCLAGGICSTPDCVPSTCAAAGATCGVIGDGCGGSLDCGPCSQGQSCGLVTANQCTMTCAPNDEVNLCLGKCGFVSDGCEDVYDCGDCPEGLLCVDNFCVDETCEPLTACPAGFNCGLVTDGCDSTLDCGDCTPPDVCGGTGEPNVCGIPDCDPLECNDLDAECGWVGDGCGGSVDCGPCPPGQLCGAGGPNRCAGCEPLSCEDVDAECGLIGDGCGGTVDCGSCPDGGTCGGETPNQCSDGPGCRKRTCESAEAECGLLGDGCGGVVDCGDCAPPEVCGFDDPFRCGTPECTPTTCEAEGAECGALGDGCGGLIDCGACGPGRPCGRDAPNQCPSVAR